MNTPETSKKLVKLVEYKIKDTLLNLIYDLAENPASKAGYIIPKSILNIKDKIEKAYVEFENVVDTTERDDFEDQLKIITREIIASGININKYVAYNEQLGEKPEIRSPAGTETFVHRLSTSSLLSYRLMRMGSKLR